jgi:hypothetical protein
MLPSMADARELRRALLDLHREALEAQRQETEQIGGRMTGAEVLQAAADDLRFSWLRNLSELVSETDAALAAAEDDAARAAAEEDLVARSRALLAPPDGESAFGRRYLRALQEHPQVVLAHRDVVAALDG